VYSARNCSTGTASASHYFKGWSEAASLAIDGQGNLLVSRRNNPSGGVRSDRKSLTKLEGEARQLWS